MATALKYDRLAVPMALRPSEQNEQKPEHPNAAEHTVHHHAHTRALAWHGLIWRATVARATYPYHLNRTDMDGRRGDWTLHAPIHKGSNLETVVRKLAGSCYNIQKLIPAGSRPELKRIAENTSSVCLIDSGM